MSTIGLKLILLFSFLCIYFGVVSADSSQEPFLEVERIKIQMDDSYPALIDVDKLKDGFAILCNASLSGAKPLIVKVDQKGTFVNKYIANGYGPGELTAVNSLIATDEDIFLSEFFTPVVHVFSHSLEFKKDYRLKKGGKLAFVSNKYVGLWSRHYDNDTVYLISLYNRKSFEPEKYIFPINRKMIPAFIQHYNGFCPVGSNGFAGVYASDFQVIIFDENLRFKRKLFKDTPEHITKYYPWTGKRNRFDTRKANEWTESFEVPYSVYFIDNHFIITYKFGGKFYLDVVDPSGHFVYKRHETSSLHLFAESKFIWRFEYIKKGDDSHDVYLVKEKLNIDRSSKSK